LKNLREIVTLRPTKGGVTTLFIPLNHCFLFSTNTNNAAAYAKSCLFFLK